MPHRQRVVHGVVVRHIRSWCVVGVGGVGVCCNFGRWDLFSLVTIGAIVLYGTREFLLIGMRRSHLRFGAA